MQCEHLKSILGEYPMSRPLNVVVGRDVLLKTTVVEMLIRLAEQPPEGLLTFCGRTDIILRERMEPTEDVAGAPPIRHWLEMSLR